MTAAQIAQPVLPRGNPGPEPWPATSASGGWWLLALLPALALGIGFWRRRKIRTASAFPSREGNGAGEVDSPLVLLAETIRAGLSQRFGPEWQAKTTEEIALALVGVSAVTAEQRTVLVELLEDADRAKFSGEVVPGPRQGEPGAGLSEALAAIGARSIRIGR